MTVQESLGAPRSGPYRLTRDDFELLDRSGAFARYGKTELLAGEIFYVNAQHRPHARLKTRLYDALRDALAAAGSTLAVMVEASVALSEHDVPEPDLTVTSEPDGAGLIPLASVALVVEVADSTLATDLGDKARLYAAAGIAEYWVADVGGRVVHQLWRPVAGGYGAQRTIAFGSPVTAETLPALVIATAPL